MSDPTCISDLFHFPRIHMISQQPLLSIFLFLFLAPLSELLVNDDLAKHDHVPL